MKIDQFNTLVVTTNCRVNRRLRVYPSLQFSDYLDITFNPCEILNNYKLSFKHFQLRHLDPNNLQLFDNITNVL